MDIRKIEKLIKLLEKTDITEMEMKEGEDFLRLSRCNQNQSLSAAPIFYQPSPPPQASMPFSTPSNVHEHKPPAALPTTTGHKIHSPMVGTMYASSSPESPPFVKVGQSVKTGDTLCLVEAMKMFNEIESDCAGIVKDILVKNGEPVEYDQLLFVIE